MKISTPTRNEIATLAATLLPSSKSAADACRTAIELLELADFAATEMTVRDAFTTAGIDRWEGRAKAIKERVALETSRPPKLREAEMLSWREFEKELFPKRPARDRLPRFRAWLQHIEKIDQFAAGDRIEDLKKNGVPSYIWGFYFQTFSTWWERDLSAKNSASGKKGQGVRKGTRKKKSQKVFGA